MSSIIKLFALATVAVLLFSSAAIAGKANYSYDANNRLVEVSEEGGAAMGYYYDSVGNRLKTDPPPQHISVNPTSVDFGDVGVGYASSPAVVTVSSNGTGALTVSGNPSDAQGRSLRRFRHHAKQQGSRPRGAGNHAGQ